MTYDFNDPDVRVMVEHRHQPTEVIFRTPEGLSIAVNCDNCGEDWPCPPVVALREFKGDARPS